MKQAKKAKKKWPINRDDSVVGLRTECFIVGYYDQGGTVLAMITDPDIAERARKQGKETVFLMMQEKLITPLP